MYFKKAIWNKIKEFQKDISYDHELFITVLNIIIVKLRKIIYKT